MPRIKKTAKRERFALYEEQISKLRLASICMRQDIAEDAVRVLISLNRKFEQEDGF